MTMALDLLRSCNWQVEKLLNRRGEFKTMVWLTETSDGRRECFETACGATQAQATQEEVLAALAIELRADFERDGVVRFATAYPAHATDYQFTPHRKPVVREQGDVVVLEAHDADRHWL